MFKSKENQIVDKIIEHIKSDNYLLNYNGSIGYYYFTTENGLYVTVFSNYVKCDNELIIATSKPYFCIMEMRRQKAKVKVLKKLGIKNDE